MDPKKRVLIVDDEQNVRLMLRTTLALVGYEVIEAVDGQAALELLRRPDFQCDLLLLDLLMPRIDGMELLRRLAHRVTLSRSLSLPHMGAFPKLSRP